MGSTCQGEVIRRKLSLNYEFENFILRFYFYFSQLMIDIIILM